MTHPPIQLEMNFDGTNENGFRQRLDLGEFQLLAEIRIPSADTPLQDAVQRAAEMEYLVHSQENPKAAIAFIDDTPPGYAMDMTQFASGLCQYARDRHLLYLRGCDNSFQDILNSVGYAVTEGFRNFCFVTGSAIREKTPQKNRKHTYLESVSILHAIQNTEMAVPIHAGAVVNPFQYTAETAYAQSCKMLRKIANGASFLVIQHGWDMMKLQEVNWNLFCREITIPTIARLLFLTPDNAEQICGNMVPGVHVPKDFIRLLREERSHSFAQFEAAQLRRMQIHAAGIRLLGYSGVQIAGVTNPVLLETIMQRIREAFREFPTFSDWRQAYTEYYAKLDMSPHPYHFYLFDKLFSIDTPEPKEKLPLMPGIQPLSRKEKLTWVLSKKLFANADSLPAGERRLTKKLLVSCRTCNSCRLPQTDFVCPELCPKGLANGSCGNCNVDGTCELQDSECIFVKRVRIANRKMDFSSLEEGCVEESSEDEKGA